MLRYSFYLLFLLLFTYVLPADAQIDTNAITRPSKDSSEVSVGNKSTLDFPVRYHSRDSTIFLVDEQIIRLYGAAEVDYNTINLKAGFIEINWKTSLLTATVGYDSLGNKENLAILKEKDGQEIIAEKIVYNFKTKDGITEHVSMQEGGGFLYGEKVHKKANDDTYLQNGWFSTCTLPDSCKHFQINAKKLKLIPKKEVISGPAYMSIEGVPTPLALPFGFFPITQKRKSGIIMPFYEPSQRLGIGITNGGYYFGISDKIDAEITGSIYSRGSYRTAVAINHQERYKYRQRLQINYANLILGDLDFRKLPDSTSPARTKLWKIIFSHEQDAKSNPYSIITASVDLGSGSYNQFNTYDANNIGANNFSSKLTWSKTFPTNPMSIIIGFESNQAVQRKFAITDKRTDTYTNVDVRLPSLNFSTGRYQPLKRTNRIGAIKWYENISLQYNLVFNNQIKVVDTVKIKDWTRNNFDFGIKHDVLLNGLSFKILKYFNFAPSVSIGGRTHFRTIYKWWNYTDTKIQTDTFNRAIQTFDIGFSGSLNTKLYTFLQFRKGVLRALRTVLTPSINYTYIPEITAYKLRNVATKPNPISTNDYIPYSIYNIGNLGTPRNSTRSGIVSFGMNGNIEMKVRSKDTSAIDGLKKIALIDNITLGTSYDIFRDSIKWSPLSLSINTTILKKINISYSSSYRLYKTNTNGQLINKLLVTDGTLAKLQSASLQLSTSLNKIVKPLTSKHATPEELEVIRKYGQYYVDFNVPYNVRIAYSMNYNPNVIIKKNRINQVINVQGDFNLTSKWKVAINSGYSISQKQISITTVDIIRDLHCWEALFNWIPVGPSKQYSITIRVKSPTLQDLKLNRRRGWYDMM